MFQKFRRSEKVRDKRRGGNHDFPSKLFCLTVPKHFKEESFSVSVSSGTEIVCGLKGEGEREYQDALWKMFCLTDPKKIRMGFL